MVAILLGCLASPALAQTSIYWDGSNTTANGAVDGGSGTWDSTTTNWTNAAGTVNLAYIPELVIFAGTAGTVTLVENLNANGLQFLTSGYVINGTNTLRLNASAAVPAPFIDIAAGATATINTPTAGVAGLTKTGAGTLILTGSFGNLGITTISAGTLQVGTGASFPSTNIVNNGTLVVNRPLGSIQTGTVISGSGAFVKTGAGR
jgi:fibronectin-binding autotransporter adhesin